MAARRFLVAAFFISGFAALLYQIIWQRLLTLFTGTDVHSATLVVAAFMAGLGFGHLAGGHLADRLTPRRRVAAFAACEFAGAAFALLSARLYYDILYVHLGAQTWSPAATALLVFTFTLWPTFFMGMSLPLISRVVTADAAEPSRWVPYLYGWNTLGAACGSFCSVLVLFRVAPFATSLRLGAALSAACGVVALLFLRPLSHAADAASAAGPPAAVIPPARDRPLPLATWLAVYALSGFVALSLEIVWFRLLGVVLKSNAATFGLLLGVYLGGIGLGSLVSHQRWVRRLPPARTFFVLQAAVPLWEAGSVTALVLAVNRVGWAAPLWSFMASGSPLSAAAIQSGRAFAIYGAFSLLLIVPPTLMMGLSFAFIQRTLQTDPGRLGRRLGWLQTANIVGAAAGALVTGVWLLDSLGSSGTLRLLALTAGVFVALHVWTSPARTARGALVPLTAVALAVLAVPGTDALWSRLQASTPERAIVSEDASGVVLLRDSEDRRTTQVFLSGISQSWLPYGSIHTALGALPAFVHPNPVRVAVIGLGSGDTAFAIGGREETEAIDSIEIVRPQLDALARLNTQSRYPALGRLLADPRVHHWFTDARALLRRRPEPYDIIEADAVLPQGAYAGLLYSVEYFELVRERLRPGGFAVTWTPTERTRASVLRAFPHVLLFTSIAIGSDRPIPFDPRAVRERLSQEYSRQYYADGNLDVTGALAPLLAEDPVRHGPGTDRTGLVDVNRDLFPQDEFRRPYRGPAIDTLAPR